MPRPEPRISLDAVAAEAERFFAQHGRWPSVGGLRHRFRQQISPTRAEQGLALARQRVRAEPEPGPPPAREASLLHQPLPSPRAPRYDQWPRLPAPCLVMADFQIPAHDPAWLEYCVGRALGLGVRRALLAGDLVDFSHLSKYPKEHLYTAEDELDDAHALVRWLSAYMPEIHVIPGNHDDRLSKKVDRQVSTSAVLERFVKRDLAGVHTYWHQQAFVGERWLVVHPGSYSKVPPAVARELATVHHRHVAMAHDHLFALGFDPSGEFFTVSFGMMADPKRLSYTHRELRRAPRMQQGALIILPDERPLLLHPRLG